MIIKSEIIQNNLDKLEQAKKDFSLLNDYASTDDNSILRGLWEEGRAYGFISYMNFIDFIRHTKKLNQEVFYKNKIKIPNFKEVLIANAPDPTVKKILKSKGKVSFTKFINSTKWDLYSGNRRRRGGVRYSDNFVASAAIIANFCIQNEIEVEDYSRISDYYRTNLSDLDPSLKKELELTKNMIDYMVESLSESNYDFRRLNVEHLSKFITEELKKKLVSIEKGESVKLIEDTDYYGALTLGKVYEVVDKEISSGRLQVIIKNDLDISRSYPYRLFETVSNLRNSVLDDLLYDS
jgi:hypothetical protein